jgi:hypothetical protein
VVFVAWRRWRFPGRSYRWQIAFALPALAAVHFTVVWVVCSGLRVWIATNV